MKTRLLLGLLDGRIGHCVQNKGCDRLAAYSLSGDVVMPYVKDAVTMPEVLSVLGDGVIKEVYSWPLSLGQVRMVMRGYPGLEMATDVIIGFDKVKTRNKYNTRRVFWDGRFYIKYSRVKGGKVYLDGEVALRVFEMATRVYTKHDDDYKDERIFENFGTHKT